MRVAYTFQLYHAIKPLKVTWGDVLTVAAAASPLLGFLDLMDRAIPTPAPHTILP